MLKSITGCKTIISSLHALYAGVLHNLKQTLESILCKVMQVFHIIHPASISSFAQQKNKPI